MFTIIGYSYYFMDSDFHHNGTFVLEDNPTISSSVSSDFQPIDVDNNKKAASTNHEILLFAALNLIIFFNCFIQLIRRLILLTPIFYQSNYVASLH
ncbi:hypothetical protein [Oceanobacillus massiliensis]|uniref:hypothetical protein n=2 Tax=Oceanobacillus massiliensis TaxID=1465765 RepID=UPI0011C82EC0|nr:hypothetical protein [Oceanobacillus massiliensis]